MQKETRKSIEQKEKETFKKYAEKQSRCINILISDMGMDKKEAMEFLKIYTLRDIESSLSLCMNLLLMLNSQKEDKP